MQTIYDILGIGIGPFNLGLAALAANIPRLTTIFLDERPGFNWHPGMMMEGTKLQVPFHADLVTLADPQSPFSYLCYLKAKQRLFRFTIREEYFPLRKEYNDYCRWVCSQLKNLSFGRHCEKIYYDEQKGVYVVCCRETSSDALKIYYSRHVVLGVGSQPYLPDCINRNHPHIFHSANYLPNKKLIKGKKQVSIVGSGQSAAEIFYDLLTVLDSEKDGEKEPFQLNWYTRSARFFPMEYSKLTLEMTSPDYLRHFYALAPAVKEKVLAGQSGLYKGINHSLIAAIYDKLYSIGLDNAIGKTPVHLQSNCHLEEVTIGESDRVDCRFMQTETRRSFQQTTDILILATGYHRKIPPFLAPVKENIRWDDRGRYDVKEHYSIDDRDSLFVQNGELHTHGFNAPDLGMGPYRNAVILNSILGYVHFDIEREVAFQSFG